jgi:spore coat polysaccharide biosynthesis protein SpsF (cytidylyltransferase family)
MANTPSMLGVVLARMDSSRLPGKALVDCRGAPLVANAIARARRIKSLTALALATTERALDDPLVAYARRAGLLVYRGSTDDVAGRVLACARRFGARYVLRINGDSPFLDAALADEGLAIAASQGCDLVTNLIGRTFPYGVAVEVIRTDALDEACRRMQSTAEREHVTRYFYERPHEFTIRSMTSARPDLAAARLVVDTPADLARFASLSEQLGDRLHTASYIEAAERALSLAAARTA